MLENRRRRQEWPTKRTAVARTADSGFCLELPRKWPPFHGAGTCLLSRSISKPGVSISPGNERTMRLICSGSHKWIDGAA